MRCLIEYMGGHQEDLISDRNVCVGLKATYLFDLYYLTHQTIFFFVSTKRDLKMRCMRSWVVVQWRFTCAISWILSASSLTDTQSSEVCPTWQRHAVFCLDWSMPLSWNILQNWCTHLKSIRGSFLAWMSCVPNHHPSTLICWTSWVKFLFLVFRLMFFFVCLFFIHLQPHWECEICVCFFLHWLSWWLARVFWEDCTDFSMFGCV